MKSVRHTATIAVFLVSSLAFAQQDDKNHDAHHPASAAASATPSTPVAKPAPKAADPTTAIDKQMQAMRTQHEKMMAAKTPEERHALMQEHMKTMRQGMSMMQGMMGRQGGKNVSPEMMQKQADMMQMMADMMKERMEKTPGK